MPAWNKKILFGLLFIIPLLLPARGIFATTSTGSFDVTAIVTSGVSCGNGIIESGETCDNGSSNGVCPATCSASCTTNDCGGVIIITPLDPLVISNVVVSNITINSATISWNTDKAAACSLQSGITTEYSGQISNEVLPSLSHSSLLSGLDIDTIYYFKISCVASNALPASHPGQFKTLAEEYEFTGCVTGLRSVSGDSQADLFWRNPVDPNFAGVIINRSTSFYPDLSDGTTVYSGAETSFRDSPLVNGTTYYYSVFAYDDKMPRHYCRRVVRATPSKEIVVPTSTPPIVPPTTTPPIYPPSTSTQDLRFRDFDFVQSNQALPVSSDDRVNTRADYSLNLSLADFKALSGTAKMVLNLSVDGQINSYLFEYSVSQKKFVTTLPPTVKAGKYFATITVLDSNNRTIKTVSGWFDASEPEIVKPPITTAIENITAPIIGIRDQLRQIAQTPAAQATAAATVALSIVAIALSTPWWNLFMLLQFLFTQPLMFFWFRKGWGTVYNSITKKPIDLALVRLYDAKTDRLLTSHVTDRNGRYIFLVDDGEYYIKVEKPGFDFPGELLKRISNDGGYLDLYYGEKIKISSGGRSAIIANIPLDQQDLKITNAQILRRVFRARLAGSLRLIGPIFALAYCIIYPTWFSGLLVAIHLVLLWVFRRLAEKYAGGKWGVVYADKQGKPVKRAITRIFSAEYGQMLEFYVTDGSGRYGFLAGNNKYYVTADKEGFGTAKTPIIDLIGKELEQTMIKQDLILSKGEKAFPLPTVPAVVEELSEKSDSTPVVTEAVVAPEIVEQPIKTEQKKPEIKVEDIFG